MVRCQEVLYIALFGALPDGRLSQAATRVAEETLRQELSLLDGRRDPQADLGEVAARVDLALRITHPAGEASSRGGLVLAQIRGDEVVVGATETGCLAIVEAGEEAWLPETKAAGRITSEVGGPLDAPRPVVRLGWVRLPPLLRRERLILATQDLTAICTPGELTGVVVPEEPVGASQLLRELASGRGAFHLGVAVLPARPLNRPMSSYHSAAAQWPDRPRRPQELEDDPDTIDSDAGLDPLATHHGGVQLVLGRLDHWLIDAKRRGVRGGPDITLLGSRDWTDVAVPRRSSHSGPRRPQPRTTPWRDSGGAPSWADRRRRALSLLLAVLLLVWFIG